MIYARRQDSEINRPWRDSQGEREYQHRDKNGHALRVAGAPWLLN